MSYKSTYLSRIRGFLFRDLPNFFRNIYKFRKALWDHRWWDYGGVLYFMEIGIEDISKGIEHKGIEVDDSRIKKVYKMNRVVEILRNIREYRYHDIVESKLGRSYIKGIDFAESKDGLYDIISKKSNEQKILNEEFIIMASELEESEWVELFDILKGQDYKKFDKEKGFDSQFDGSGIRGWWD